MSQKRSTRAVNAANRSPPRRSRVTTTDSAKSGASVSATASARSPTISVTIREVEERYKFPHFKEPDGHFATVIAPGRAGHARTVLDLADAEIGQTSPGDFCPKCQASSRSVRAAGPHAPPERQSPTWLLTPVDAVLRSVVAGLSSVHPRANFASSLVTPCTPTLPKTSPTPRVAVLRRYFTQSRGPGLCPREPARGGEGGPFRALLTIVQESASPFPR